MQNTYYLDVFNNKKKLFRVKHFYNECYGICTLQMLIKKMKSQTRNTPFTTNSNISRTYFFVHKSWLVDSPSLW